MFRHRTLWLLACLLILLSIASAQATLASSKTGMVRLSGHVLPRAGEGDGNSHEKPGKTPLIQSP